MKPLIDTPQPVESPCLGDTEGSESNEEFQAFNALSYQAKYALEVAAPADKWVTYIPAKSVKEKSLTGWSPIEKDAVTRGLIPCPLCGTTRRDGIYKEWQVNTVLERTPEGKTRRLKVWRFEPIPCPCQGWKWVWHQVRKQLFSAYSYVNLWTLQPDFQSRLPKDVQQQEIDRLRIHSNESYLFLGPSGTGKTTFSYALFREAYERDTAFFCDPDVDGKYDFPTTHWIWRGNFSLLLQQFNTKQNNRDAKDPDVTADMILAAGELAKSKLADGRERTPVLILEELDKVEFNPHRIKYLFGLLDAITNIGGRLIVTTNLTLPELYKMLTATDEIRVTGETILRRLIDGVNIRNYFKHKQGD